MCVGGEGGGGEEVSHAMFNGNRTHLVLQPLQSAEESVESWAKEAAPAPHPSPSQSGSELGNSAQMLRGVLAGVGWGVVGGLQAKVYVPHPAEVCHCFWFPTA